MVIVDCPFLQASRVLDVQQNLVIKILFFFAGVNPALLLAVLFSRDALVVAENAGRIDFVERGSLDIC